MIFLLKNYVFLLSTCISIVLLSACGTSEAEVGHQHIVSGDIRETTVSFQVLPTFLEDSHEDILAIYERVPEHKELLEHIPCYCGCGESVGHRNSYQCFVHQHFESGNIEWDDHGTKCGVCLEIAYYSMELSEQGISDLEIRQFIDEAYKEGYAAPTKTPMPE